jgi:5-formyltetrahydrofolate cyclo-ligase
LRLASFRRALKVACYLPFDGEVDLTRLFVVEPTGRKSFCLPAVSRSHGHEMRFLEYRPGDWLVKNRFGIGEPLTHGNAVVSSSAIDVALMPVVGFDQTGSRIGMGAGFYDRYFGRGARAGHRHARLVGIAFECQKLPRIERQGWDVPLDLIITEKAIYRTGDSFIEDRTR